MRTNDFDIILILLFYVKMNMGITALQVNWSLSKDSFIQELSK